MLGESILGVWDTPGESVRDGFVKKHFKIEYTLKKVLNIPELKITYHKLSECYNRQNGAVLDI